jgi:L-threonylcarbamoyladenylate synthase
VQAPGSLLYWHAVTRTRAGHDPAAVAEAARLLADGELVAFPTETVYGLGADATSAGAARRIYAAKGRPSTNPLIVHVADLAEAQRWATGWDSRAQQLAERFWPGPLTLVLGRSARIPAEVAGGGDTLALRAPDHPVAQALLRAFGGPIAAPSANRSNHVSPTQAEHVVAELGGRIPLVLDGGPCAVGLESTVLSLTDPAGPRILRPGHITARALSAVLGEHVAEGAPARGRHAPDEASALPSPALASPGLLERHYAPRTPVVLAPRATLEAHGPADAIYVVRAPLPGRRALVLPADPAGYARALYSALRAADDLGAAALWVEEAPEGEAWAAARDRLRRASHPG